jgi:hypothetical protein
MQVGFDTQNVIFLRVMRLSAGGARGQSEARRMVSEKIASLEAQAAAVLGIIAGRNEAVVAGQVIRGLQKRVRANKRRLSRK